VGDGLGINDGEFVGLRVVGDLVGCVVGDNDVSHGVHSKVIHVSTDDALSEGYTFHMLTSIGGMFIQSSDASYRAITFSSPTIAQNPSMVQ